MFTVYSGSGAKDFSIGDKCISNNQWATFRRGATSLLRARGNEAAVGLFESLPFELRQGENFFGDEFVVLYAELPMERYVEFVDRYANPQDRFEFRQIAHALSEICPLYIRFIAFDAVISEGVAPIEEPQLQITNRVVEEALADARQLISARGSTSGVDRAHTAFHGYLRALCNEAGIETPDDADITKLYRNLRDHHPKIVASGARSSDITQTLRALSSIVAVLNPLRNRASLAHPNLDLLDQPEADLVLNCIHTLLRYLDLKLR